MRCGHWLGCGLEEAHSIYPGGVPLVGFLDDRGILVSIVCEHCEAALLLPPFKVIRRLKGSGRGNGNTGVLALGRAIRGPCRKCGADRFKTGPIWPKQP